VKGHYKKGNKRHTKGHFRRVSRKPSGKGSSGGNSPGQSNPGQSNPGQGAPAFTGGDPLPPIDPVLPAFSKTKASKRRR
jgi:hypothetical protein